MGRNIEKFYFDQNNFDDPREKDEDLPPSLTILEEEFERQKKISYEEGYKNGEREGRALSQQSIESEISAKLDVLLRHLGSLEEQERSRHLVFEKETIRLGYSLFKKLYPRLKESIGYNEIEAFVLNVLNQDRKLPQFEIVVHSEHLAAIQKRVEDAEAVKNAPFDIAFKADDKMALTDVGIRWSDGGTGLYVESVAQKIDMAFQALLFEDGIDLANKDGVILEQDTDIGDEAEAGMAQDAQKGEDEPKVGDIPLEDEGDKA